jgi:hypothetical protein
MYKNNSIRLASTCLASARPWVQLLVLPKKKKKTTVLSEQANLSQECKYGLD